MYKKYTSFISLRVTIYFTQENSKPHTDSSPIPHYHSMNSAPKIDIFIEKLEIESKYTKVQLSKKLH